MLAKGAGGVEKQEDSYEGVYHREGLSGNNNSPSSTVLLGCNSFSYTVGQVFKHTMHQDLDA